MSNNIDKTKLLPLYSTIKSIVIESGYYYEIEWQKKINVNIINENYFIREAAWVILSSGMKEQIIRKLFLRISEAFFNWSLDDIIPNISNCRKNALKIFKHKKKIDAIIYIIKYVKNNGFEKVKNSIKEGEIDYISTFPYMGPATSYHFAKNLGIDVVKPDRHLLRISKKLGFKSPYDFCSEISHQSGDKISVIDLIFWRFANMNKNYLNELILKPL